MEIERLFMHGTLFLRQWKSLAFDEYDLILLERALLENPKRGKVFRDTGYIRKTRMPFRYEGRQGTARICYVEFEDQETLYLLAVFAKREEKHLSPDERFSLKWQIRHLEHALPKGEETMHKAYAVLSDALDEAVRDANHEPTRLKRHRVKMEIPPLGEFSAEDIKRIRHQQGVPQRLFAEFLGVSKRTVEAWEIGRGKPTGPSSRLLGLLQARKLSITE